MEISKEVHSHLLRQMLTIRRFEERSGQLYGLRKIGGFCHLYIGEEAVAVGAIATLSMETDYVAAAYRDHGHAIACGMELNPLMAELLGKETGCSRGKGGSMHFFDAEKHFMGGNGIVGAHLPVAAGIGLKIRYMEEKGVVLAFFGDGAIHQGAFHEALNLAKVWHCPVIYICENNQYGMGTDFRRVSSQHDFSKMAVAYDIVGKQISGMDAANVYSEVKPIVDQVREEQVPALLEIKTYRFVGHSMSDPAKYRTKEELKEFKAQDPIATQKERMIAAGQLTEEEFKALDKEIRAEVEESVKFAESSPEPAIESMYEDVLV